MSVALVTDSTASLDPSLAAGRDIAVVPLQVVIGSRAYDEGPDESTHSATPTMVAEALREFTPVSTSRPAPAAMLAAYARAQQAGASEVVSVHISSEMSATYESAQLAARQAERELGLRVVPVDSRQVGMSVGFAVLAAAEVRDAGGDADAVAAAARSRSADTTSLFYVDTLEYLRRGGRMGAAAALLGSALAVKPILRIEDGRVSPFERVRTSGKALARLEELAVEAAAVSSPSPLTGVDVGVFHLAAAERAQTLADRLADRLSGALEGRPVVLGELGAVLGAHVGPGMVAVSVSRRLT